MNRFRIGRGFIPLRPDHVVKGARSVVFKTESETLVYVASTEEFETEVLAACGKGEFELSVESSELDYLRVHSEGRVWANVRKVDHTVAVSVFTNYATLDRPPPMSPEMAMVARMMRQNALDREALLNEMRKTQDERSLRITAQGAERTRAGRKAQKNSEDGENSKRSPEDVEGLKDDQEFTE